MHQQDDVEREQRRTRSWWPLRRDRAALDSGGVERAKRSLRALSLGDALGETFFGHPDLVMARIESRTLPTTVCRWTDDTLMACSIVSCLDGAGRIDPDRLIRSFADRFEMDRGYGHGSRDLLAEVRRGGDWRRLAPAMFDGRGSFGNGAAMRVPPLGAFHAGDAATAATVAATQAAVTHAHPEGAAGAMAVAVAAALVAAGPIGFDDLLVQAAEHTPASLVRDGIMSAIELGADADVATAAGTLGSGREIAAFDTVPFALWSVAVSPDDIEAVFWRTVAGLGDRDTTCAIACGVAGAGTAELPDRLHELIEPLPSWV